MVAGMQAHDPQAVVASLGELEFRELAPFDRGTLGVYWATGGTSPWERHPDNDELLLILEGHADIEILTTDGPVVTPVRTGCLIVVPRGLWHRHRLHGRVKELYLTPGPSEHSTADDPRA
jgi:mannose-6-phosphate isomerase-like protein (cupin superfamily)